MIKTDSFVFSVLSIFVLFHQPKLEQVFADIHQFLPGFRIGLADQSFYDFKHRKGELTAIDFLKLTFDIAYPEQ